MIPKWHTNWTSYLILLLIITFFFFLNSSKIVFQFIYLLYFKFVFEKRDKLVERVSDRETKLYKETATERLKV